MSDFKAKMHQRQIRFRLVLRPRPRWGSLQRSPRPLAGFKGAASRQGRKGEGWGGREEEWREGRESEGMVEGRGKVTEGMEGQDMMGGKGKGGMGGKGRRGATAPLPNFNSWRRHCSTDFKVSK